MTVEEVERATEELALEESLLDAVEEATETELLTEEEDVHVPKRALQPVPQWSVDVPHQPYWLQQSPHFDPRHVCPP